MFLTMLKCIDVVELELTSLPAYQFTLNLTYSHNVSLATNLYLSNDAYIIKPAGSYSIQFNHGRVHAHPQR